VIHNYKYWLHGWKYLGNFNRFLDQLGIQLVIIISLKLHLLVTNLFKYVFEPQHEQVPKYLEFAPPWTFVLFFATPSTSGYYLFKPSFLLWIRHYPIVIPWIPSISYLCMKFEKFYHMIGTLFLTCLSILKSRLANHGCDSPIPC
jgi:hypothetical protein